MESAAWQQTYASGSLKATTSDGLFEALTEALSRFQTWGLRLSRAHNLSVSLIVEIPNEHDCLKEGELVRWIRA